MYKNTNIAQLVDFLHPLLIPHHHSCAGIAPPNQRNEDDFDFGSRRHVPEGVDHVRFFASHVFQFQFYKALCEAAGHYNAEGHHSMPLHKCNLYGE